VKVFIPHQREPGANPAAVKPRKIPSGTKLSGRSKSRSNEKMLSGSKIIQPGASASTKVEVEEIPSLTKLASIWKYAGHKAQLEEMKKKRANANLSIASDNVGTKKSKVAKPSPVEKVNTPYVCNPHSLNILK